ncbi:MAG: hypothetical protein LBE20_04290 [Deltaproteobacteria bacterium]|jgi:spermidine synthase|nr:hypothetical protein [Deltaproteobacteria bacterium]
MKKFQILQACCFLSGGVALILEVVYQKYLATLIGSTTPAVTIVLVTYFLGLSVGSIICPKRGGNPRLRLAFLEFCIAIWSVVLVVSFYESYNFFSEFLSKWGNNALTLGFVRWLIAMFWILPPSIAMGAHLPTLEVFLENEKIATSKNLTKLYTLNITGACFFTLVTPFLFFQNLGLEGTLLLSAVIGFVVTIMLFYGLRDWSQNTDTSCMTADKIRATFAESAKLTAANFGTPEVSGTLNNYEKSTTFPYWPFVFAVLSGFILFSLEVLWNHLIASVIGASTYSFSILLAVILFSLAIAGREVEKQAPNGTKKVRIFIVNTIGRLIILLPIIVCFWPIAGKFLANVATTWDISSFWAGEFLKLCITFLLIAPVAISVGVFFPATFYAMQNGSAPDGKKMGYLNMLNSCGCVSGALIANYVLIPMFGAEYSFKLIWWILLFIYVFLYVKFKDDLLQVNGNFKLRNFLHLGRDIIRPIAILFIFFILIGVYYLRGWNRNELTAGYGVYMRGGYSSGDLIYFHEDQYSGFVTVIENKLQNPYLGRATMRTLLQNGKFDANDGGEMLAQIGVAFIPSLFSPRDERALVIGLGSGQTTYIVSQMGFKNIDVCEMSPGHVEAARNYFNHINKDVLEQTNVHLYLEDGRNFLTRTQNLYDIISIEISSIWFSGASNLYSREFYQQVKEHLSEEGILQQWIQFHHLSEKEIVTVIATLKESFHYIEVWLFGGQAMLIASNAPFSFNKEKWQHFISSPTLEEERQIVKSSLGELNEKNFLQTRLLDNNQVETIIAQIPHVINTDRNKWLEFHTPLYYLSKKDHLTENIRLFLTIAK